MINTDTLPDLITIGWWETQNQDMIEKDLVYALKGADDKTKQIIFSNVSSRMAETIQSDLEVTMNVRLRDVEEAQQKIVAIIRRLEEEGEVIIVRGGKDEIIV